MIGAQMRWTFLCVSTNGKSASSTVPLGYSWVAWATVRVILQLFLSFLLHASICDRWYGVVSQPRFHSAGVYCRLCARPYSECDMDDASSSPPVHGCWAPWSGGGASWPPNSGVFGDPVRTAECLPSIKGFMIYGIPPPVLDLSADGVRDVHAANKDILTYPC